MSSLCLMLIKSSWLNSSLELATLTLSDNYYYINDRCTQKGKLINGMTKPEMMLCTWE